MTAALKNPYVGLRPFDTDESILFFGRNDQTLELLQRLHQYHFVAVVGGSGCGKSSLLRAGLIPSLKAGYLVDTSDQWSIAIMKPGQSPLYNLAEAMLQLVYPQVNTVEVAAAVQQIKEEGADVLLRILASIVTDKKSNIFLLIDQFEELFRFSMEQHDVDKKDEAIDFVNIMLELAQQQLIPVYVVMTMRSDFIGDCARFFGLPEAMNQSQYLVPRLNRIQMKTVIEGPAKLYGGTLNPSLTSMLLNEIGKVKDELPLLQHALMRIWDYETKENKNGELDLKDYRQIGGIEKALSNHADEALKGMDIETLGITKEMFQALTAIDENGRKIRRPVLLSQLTELCNSSKEKLLDIISLFIKDNRCFLIKNNAGETGDVVIDISHESLIRQWKTLNNWVDEEGEYALVYLQLAEAYRLHTNKKKDYLSGTELDLALEWYNTFKPSPTWANRYKEGFTESIAYLQQSDKIRNEKVAEGIAIEKAEAEKVKAAEEARRLEKRRRIKRNIITSAIVALAVIIFLVFYSINSRQKEIAALNSKEEAKAAEQRTQELLQLVVSGRGEGYENRDFNAVVARLRTEQTYPIDSLIVPRAIKVPITNTNLYDWLIWIDVPSFRRKEIKNVVYKWPCTGFIDSVHVGKEASLGFAFGYRGWGSCPNILINVALVNGEAIKIEFPMREYLLRNGDAN